MDTRIASSGSESPSTGACEVREPQTARSEIVETPAVALSIQHQMARLNMTQAFTSKKAATEKLNEVKEAQKEIHKLRGYANRLARCKDHDCDISEFKDIEQDLGISLCTFKLIVNDYSKFKFGLVFGVLGYLVNKKEYTKCGANETDANLRMVSGAQEQATAKMQSAMTQLQDFMAQYQSYADGARTAAAKANEFMLKLAR